MYLLRHISIVSLVWPAVPAAMADTSTPDSALLPQVVITGTRTEKALLDVPVRTEVVSRDELDKTHARDLAQALEDVPGLLLRDTAKRNGSQGAWLQGLDADRVLILIDGEPVAASTGSTVDLSQIAVADVERIEIVKGATSALYGSEAMGGVINIITRQTDKPTAYKLVIDGGSYLDKNPGAETAIAARHMLADMSLARSQWKLRLTGDVRDSDGYDLDKSSWRTEGDQGSKANLDGRIAYVSPNGDEYFFSPRFYRESLGNRLSTFAPGAGEIKRSRRETIERVRGSLGGKWRLDNEGRLSAVMSAERFTDVTDQDVLVTPQLDQRRQAEIRLAKLELQWDRPVGDNQLLTLGLSAYQESLSQNQRRIEGANIIDVEEITPGANRRNTAVFIQNDQFIGDAWELLPGLRLQDDSDFGFFAAPKLNLMFSPDWFETMTTQIRLGYGKGYRVPNLKERYFVFDHSALGYMVLGNADLQPESSDSFQAGIEFARRGGFRADINLYHNRIKNLIDTRLNPLKGQQLGLQIFDYQNVSRALTQGLEFTASRQLGSAWRVNAGYTLLGSKDRDTGKVLTQRPRHQAKWGLDYQAKSSAQTISLRGVYQSREYVDAENNRLSPGWSTLDIKLTQPVSKSFSVFTGIDNISDEHRRADSSRDYRPRQGRFAYLGMRFDG